MFAQGDAADAVFNIQKGRAKVTVVSEQGKEAVVAIPAFAVRPEDTQGRFLHALGNGQWDIPALRALLSRIRPEHGAIEDF